MLLRTLNLFLFLLAALPVCAFNPETIEEKVGQLLIVHFQGSEANEEAEKLIQKAFVGGIIYYNWANDLTSPKQVSALSASLQQKAKIPLWICIDQEGGPVTRLKKGFKTYPGNRELANKSTPQQAFKIATQAAIQLRSVGVNMNLAPVVDISTDPETSYMTSRTFGNDPEVVMKYAKPVMEAFREQKVLPVLKHFPGYGGAAADPHSALPILNKTLPELLSWELMPFIELKPEAIMSAHLFLPLLDNKHCATLSKKILQNLLRWQLGFQGLVISDSLTMQGVLKDCASIEEAAIQAINSGCDLIILGGTLLVEGQEKQERTAEDNLKLHAALVNAVKEGRIPLSRIEEAVGRSLALKEKYLSELNP